MLSSLLKAKSLIHFDFYQDGDSGKRHIAKHNVTLEEINEFFNDSVFFEKQRQDKSFIAYSRLKSGRCLKVIYRKLSKANYFIITAFDLEDLYMIQLLDKEIQ
ncbi:MAG TPA: hypothetical protein ENI73_02930 [Spirochaetes bacterium]|nr:hypothetical protein [Spirochaetota bacterium]